MLRQSEKLVMTKCVWKKLVVRGKWLKNLFLVMGVLWKFLVSSRCRDTCQEAASGGVEAAVGLFSSRQLFSNKKPRQPSTFSSQQFGRQSQSHKTARSNRIYPTRLSVYPSFKWFLGGRFSSILFDSLRFSWFNTAHCWFLRFLWLS